MPSEPDNPRLLPAHQAEELSAGRARRRALDLHGPGGAAAAAARARVGAWCRQRSRFVSKRWQECNWLQAMEGGIDSSHVSFLHRYTMKVDPMFKGATKSHKYNLGDLAPHFEVVESPGGLYIGARRNAENDKYYWRITQWILPCFTLIPPRGDHPIGGHCWVPIDDENCWAWSINHHADARAHRRRSATRWRPARASTCRSIPGTFRPRRQQGQRLPDRPQAQKDGRTFSRRRGLRDAGRVACRRAWGRSRTARARTSCRPTRASSWRAAV